MSFARIVDRPEPGFFRVRKYRGGPWVQARIRRVCMCTIGGSVLHDHTEACDRRGSLVAEIDGRETDPSEVWQFGHPVTADEFWRIGESPAAPLNEQPPVF